ncbi:MULTISPECIES: GNAT family N-acetyltransferase [unclassified Actinoplanes]|uniref:GNAT family N-acetyltransferase n=1 Tax=unclassified Actinoplanes TaxID=2626549 RepID=UPI0002FC9F19|nr:MULTISPECIES: GNAT family N-acetyltransferase [unclassified Actinoplanes]
MAGSDRPGRETQPLTLRVMTPESFRRRRAEMVMRYAVAGGEAAEAAAARQIDAALPGGPDTPGELLRSAWSGPHEVGWIWASMPGRVVPDLAWIDELVVDEGFRRRGFGEAIMRATEAALAAGGATRAALNVFGGNDGARRLYERLGYTVTLQELTAVPYASPPGPVTLVPLAGPAARIEASVAATAAEFGLGPVQARERVMARQTPATVNAAVVAGGRAVGWVSYSPRHFSRPRSGGIYRLDIDPPYRSVGYGTAAVRAVLTELAGLPGVLTSVPRPAVWLHRLGFRLSAQHMAHELPTGGKRRRRAGSAGESCT